MAINHTRAGKYYRFKIQFAGAPSLSSWQKLEGRQGSEKLPGGTEGRPQVHLMEAGGGWRGLVEAGGGWRWAN